MKRISVFDIIVVIVLSVSLVITVMAAYIYLKKEADYQASQEEYEEIKSEYVSHLGDDESVDAVPDDTTDEKPGQITNDTSKEEPLPVAAPDIDWDGLKAENGDIIGWIEVPAVGIQYPVLQGIDNQEYLHQTVNGEWRTAGSIFLDSENSADMTDKHSIVYGHNMRNGAMFASLRNFNSQEVYEICPYFWICTERKDLLYKIISVHVAVTGDESFTLFRSSSQNKEFAEWLRHEADKSQINCPVPDRYIERLLTMSTCTPSSDNTRQLVQGILVREVKN